MGTSVDGLAASGRYASVAGSSCAAFSPSIFSESPRYLMGLTLLTFLRSNESISALDDLNRLRTGVDSSSPACETSRSSTTLLDSDISSQSAVAADAVNGIVFWAECMSCSTDTLEAIGVCDPIGAPRRISGDDTGDEAMGAIFAPKDDTLTPSTDAPGVTACRVFNSLVGLRADAMDCRAMAPGERRLLTLSCSFILGWGAWTS